MVRAQKVKLDEHNRGDERVVSRLEQRLARQIRVAYWDAGEPLANVVSRFHSIRPREWILDVVFYRTFRTADDFGAFM